MQVGQVRDQRLTSSGSKRVLGQPHRAILGLDTSVVVTHDVVKVDHSWELSLDIPFDNQYSAGGDQALIDGLQGGSDFRTGEWQGFWGVNCAATIDLGQLENVNTITLGALQDIKPWIWSPKSVRFSSSLDGNEFDLLATAESSLDERDEAIQIEHFRCEVPVTARYIKLEVEGRGPIPDWHLGRGNDRWTFLDEIVVELEP